MITATTYGTWMRGDRRGWIDKGVLKPQNEAIEAHDRQRQQHETFRFTKDQLLEIGAMMGKSLIERQHHKILALTIQTDHFHLLIGATFVDVPKIAKCAKEAVRFGPRATTSVIASICNRSKRASITLKHTTRAWAGPRSLGSSSAITAIESHGFIHNTNAQHLAMGQWPMASAELTQNRSTTKTMTHTPRTSPRPLAGG